MKNMHWRNRIISVPVPNMAAYTSVLQWWRLSIIPLFDNTRWLTAASQGSGDSTDLRLWLLITGVLSKNAMIDRRRRNGYCSLWLWIWHRLKIHSFIRIIAGNVVIFYTRIVKRCLHYKHLLATCTNVICPYCGDHLALTKPWFFPWYISSKESVWLIHSAGDLRQVCWALWR